MNLATLISNGTISIEELANAPELIERAKFVKESIEACKKNIQFPFGVDEVHCYSYMDRAGEYESWGKVSRNGLFICYSNWGGNHEIGRVNLLNSTEVFMAFENDEFVYDLKRFLSEQISKV